MEHQTTLPIESVVLIFRECDSANLQRIADSLSPPGKPVRIVLPLPEGEADQRTLINILRTLPDFFNVKEVVLSVYGLTRASKVDLKVERLFLQTINNAPFQVVWEAYGKAYNEEARLVLAQLYYLSENGSIRLDMAPDKSVNVDLATYSIPWVVQFNPTFWDKVKSFFTRK